MPAPGQRHDESPGRTQLTALRIQHLAGVAEIDLGLFAGLDFDAYDNVWPLGFQGADEAPHRGVTADIMVLVLQPLKDRGHFDALFAQLRDDLTERRHRRNVLRRQCTRPGLSQPAVQFLPAG